MAIEYWEAYEYPNITGGFANVTSYANSVTSGYLGLGILLSFWIVLYLIFRRWGDMEGLVASSFISFIVAGVLAAMGLINGLWLILPMVVTAAALFLGRRGV